MERNRKSSFAVVFVLMLLLSGCGGGGGGQAVPEQPPAFSPASPAEAEALYRQAEQAHKAGKINDAIGLWEKIVQKYPGTALAAGSLNRIGEVYLAQGQPDRATQYFEYLLYAYPRWEGVPNAKLNLFQVQAQTGKKKQVMRDAVPLWESSANKPEVRYGLARLMMKLYGEEDDIQTAFDWSASGFSASLSPEQKKTLAGDTGELLSRADERTVRKLYQKNPSDFMRVFLDFRYAQIVMQQGREDQAHELLKTALAQNPSHPLAPEIQAALRGTKVAQTAQPPLNADRVGVLVPLNGPNGKYGDMVVRGLNVALSDWNGAHPDQKITLAIKDAGAEPAAVVESFDALTKQEGVLAVIGPLGMQATKAVAPAANRDGVPLLTLTQKEEDSQDNSFVVHVFIDSRELVQTLVRYCREKLKFERFASLYPDDRYGQKLAKIFAEVVQEEGGTIIASASYKEKSTDFREPLQKLLNIAKKNAPLSAPEGTPFDALFIPDQVQTVSLVAPQLPYNNIVGTTLLGTNLWSEAPLVKSGGVYVEHALFATSFYPESGDPRVKAFREKYESVYGVAPSYLEAQAYDALTLLLQARSAARGTGSIDRNPVLQSLLQAKDFKGVAGTYTAGPRGDLERQYVVLQVVNGQLAQVYP